MNRKKRITRMTMNGYLLNTKQQQGYQRGY